MMKGVATLLSSFVPKVAKMQRDLSIDHEKVLLQHFFLKHENWCRLGTIIAIP
jgi:hypothetical protein